MNEEQNNLKAADRGTNDAILTNLLGAWKRIEPDEGFEAGVWRRIWSGQIPASLDAVPVPAVREWAFWRPSAAAAVIAASVIIGGLLAFMIPWAGRRQHVSTTLSHPRTLAGAYLSMAAGETQ